MLHTLSRSCLALALAMFSAASVAGPVLQGTTTNPTGFTGIVIDGRVYDVTFTTLSFDAAFASTPPTFLNNLAGALDASFALANALNAAHVTELGDVAFLPFLNSFYTIYVPSFVFAGQNRFATYGVTLGNLSEYPWLAIDTAGISDQPGGLRDFSAYHAFAVFTAVPEPSVPSLIVVTGFALFAMIRRKHGGSL